MKKLIAILLFIPTLLLSQTKPIGAESGKFDTLGRYRPSGTGNVVVHAPLKVDSGAVIINKATIDSTLVNGLMKGTGALWMNGITGSTPTSGVGSRLMWIPQKRAFRAGRVFGTEWDNSNIGFYSVAFGQGNTASASSTFAAGDFNLASGAYASSTGLGDTVSGVASAAFGVTSTVSGNSSFSYGQSNSISASSSMIIGDYDTISGGDFNRILGNQLSKIGSGSYTTTVGYNFTNAGASNFMFALDNIMDTSTVGHGVIAVNVPFIALNQYNVNQYDEVGGFTTLAKHVADSVSYTWIGQRTQNNNAGTITYNLRKNRGYRDIHGVDQSRWLTLMNWDSLNTLRFNDGKSSEWTYGDVIVENGKFGVTNGIITIGSDTASTKAYARSLIPSVSGFVPYTGATSNLNLGLHGFTGNALSITNGIAPVVNANYTLSSGNYYPLFQAGDYNNILNNTWLKVDDYSRRIDLQSQSVYIGDYTNGNWNGGGIFVNSLNGYVDIGDINNSTNYSIFRINAYSGTGLANDYIQFYNQYDNTNYFKVTPTYTTIGNTAQIGSNVLSVNGGIGSGAISASDSIVINRAGASKHLEFTRTLSGGQAQINMGSNVTGIDFTNSSNVPLIAMSNTGNFTINYGILTMPNSHTFTSGLYDLTLNTAFNCSTATVTGAGSSSDALVLNKGTGIGGILFTFNGTAYPSYIRTYEDSYPNGYMTFGVNASPSASYEAFRIYSNGNANILGTLTMPNSNTLTGNANDVGFNKGINVGTVVTSYNGIVPEGFSVPIIVDSVERTETASVGTTNLNSTNVPGYYEVSGYIQVTSGTALGAITVTIGATDAVGTYTITPILTFAATGTGRTYFSPIPIRTASGYITYATTVAGTPTHKLSLVCRRLY